MHFLPANFLNHDFNGNADSFILNNFQVSFEDFKEGFVAVLSLAIDNLSSSEDEADSTLDNTGKSHKCTAKYQVNGTCNKSHYFNSFCYKTMSFFDTLQQEGL